MNEASIEIITVQELMDCLYIGKNTAYELLTSGQIKAFKIGRVWKIPKVSIENYILNSAEKYLK